MGEHIRVKHAGEAWNALRGMMETIAEKFVTVDGVMTREIENVMITITNPREQDWPIEGSLWNKDGLEKYAGQLMNPDVMGFEYTYGNRLRKYFGVDQIAESIEMLKRFPGARQATMVIWDAVKDLADERVPVATIEHPLREKPCMTILNPLIRHGKLNMTVVFRSQDMIRAWPQNTYGVFKIQEYMAKELGVEVGTLTTMAISAHEYV